MCYTLPIFSINCVEISPCIYMMSWKLLGTRLMYTTATSYGLRLTTVTILSSLYLINIYIILHKLKYQHN